MDIKVLVTWLLDFVVIASFWGLSGVIAVSRTADGTSGCSGDKWKQQGGVFTDKNCRRKIQVTVELSMRKVYD